MKKVVGIYTITNIINKKIYIGSSINLYHRQQAHLSTLSKNKHHNCKLQSGYNKYSKDNFQFQIIEICKEDVLLEREQYWIDTLCPWYNISPTAYSNKGIKRTKEFCQKMSQQRKGCSITANQLQSLRRGWEKRGKLLSLKVKQIDPTTKVVLKVWDSIADASRELKLFPQSISFACKKKNKLSGGFEWNYLN